MKNKVKLKKLILKILFISIMFVFLFLFIHTVEYKTYTKNFNNKISGIINKIHDKYPDLSDNEIIELLNNEKRDESFFKDYNIDINKETIILMNDKSFYRYSFYSVIYLFLIILTLTWLFFKFNKSKDKEINDITKYIQEINKKNYKLEIDDISEDELSILKNEIYKTTIMLKEQALNSSKEKSELKTSLSDISHQLKTPLTSILIILDNLIDNPDMDKITKEVFLFDIKREINNINFLVQTLLKLSKLDTNTVEFINKEVSLDKIVNKSIENLSMLCDLKNITIKVNKEKNAIIKTDFNWQVEAITNILKNCIEHSFDNSDIDISIEENKIYSEIIIQDYGIGIDESDIPHIFERFYKGKNSSKDSIGIGLALAKTIIEQSNGKIFVESKINKGTKLNIRYYDK